MLKSLHGVRWLSWYLGTHPKVDLRGTEEMKQLGCSVCRLK